MDKLIGCFLTNHNNKPTNGKMVVNKTSVVKVDDNTPLGYKLLTAGTAACIADFATFPLDTAKVRLQVRTQSVPSYFTLGQYHCSCVYSQPPKQEQFIIPHLLPTIPRIIVSLSQTSFNFIVFIGPRVSTLR